MPATRHAFATTAPATAPTTGPGETVAGAAPSRRPIPPPADRQRAAALAGEVFAADLADASPSARRSLANRLLRESENAASDTERFAVLIGAIHAADDAKDLPLCFRAIDALTARFDVDDLAIRARCALSPSLEADADAQTAANCRVASGLVDSLMAADDFADASRLARVLVRASSVDRLLNAEIKEQAARVETLGASRAKLDGDMKKLRAAPADPAANLAVGKFLCFGVGAWERGLPMLRIGSDAGLSALAKQELDGPADGASELAVADGWWDVAENDAGLHRTQVRQHAARWYTSAVPLLKGLERAKARKRIAEAGDAVAQAHQAEPWSFKSPRAIKAKKEYDEAVSKAEAQANELKSAARSRLVRILGGAMADATRAGDVDEALRMRNSLESLTAGASEGTGVRRPVDELVQRLPGTRWRVGSVELTFGKGAFTFSDWGGKQGTWQVVARQTIACVDKDGKRYEFTFDPGLNVIMEVADGVYIGPAIRDRSK